MAFKMKNTGGAFKMMGSSPAKMASPMKATGDPVKGAGTETEEEKQALIDNAMGTAEVNTLGSATMSRLKDVFGNVNPSLEEAKAALKKARAMNGDANNLYAVLKARFPGQFHGDTWVGQKRKSEADNLADSALKAKGDPVKGADTETEAGKQDLIDNAMDSATSTGYSDEFKSTYKKHFGSMNASPADMKLAIRKQKGVLEYNNSEEAQTKLNEMRKMASQYQNLSGIKF
tara:strand:+ start:482 stop:1174 length:693 start_codon:yes stop_codon:yes gene_type:complete